MHSVWKHVLLIWRVASVLTNQHFLFIASKICCCCCCSFCCCSKVITFSVEMKVIWKLTVNSFHSSCTYNFNEIQPSANEIYLLLVFIYLFVCIRSIQAVLSCFQNNIHGIIWCNVFICMEDGEILLFIWL